MNLNRNLGLLYHISPFLSTNSIIENKLSLIISILFGSNKIKVRIKKLPTLFFEKKDFNLFLSFIGSLTFCVNYTKIDNNSIEISFDLINKFTIPLHNFSKEDKNLIETLFLCVRAGSDFITSKKENIQKCRSKTLKIYEDEGKKIIETYSGIKFYLDSINPGNTILECFIDDIHSINNLDDWSGKTVVDVGAECGDTPLYYASKGASVIAFEPIKSNFESMKRNLSLNPTLASKIIIINAAVGKDGKLKFFQSPDTPEIGSSFVYNRYGDTAHTTEVDGYSFEKILNEFKINKIDLLKLDCKGCEIYLTENILHFVNAIKIEYVSQFTSQKFEELKQLLEKSGFTYVVYRNSQFARLSNRLNGHFFAKKKT